MVEGKLRGKARASLEMGTTRLATSSETRKET
jgi:hypothetical protein